MYFAKAFPPNPGGVERYSLDLALALRERGYSPVVLTQHEGPRGLRRRYGLPVYNVGPGPQALVFLLMSLAARRVRRGRRFAFSYATTWRVALPALLTAAPRPLGCTIHGREVFVPRGPVARVMRWVLRRVDQVFSISRFTLDESRRRGALRVGKGIRNWNGFTPPEAPAAESATREADGPIELFTICRLVGRKNLDGALRALALLRREGRLGDVRYRIAGDGEERPRLERLIAEEGLGDTVQLLGRVTDEEKVALYHAADVFLHPQVTLRGGDDAEGFGLVIAEAMAYGVPVVVGRDGGTADFVVHGKTGCVVDGRSDRSIADGIATLLDNPETRRRYATDGRAWVESNLGWDRHADTVLRSFFPSRSARSHASEPPAHAPELAAARC